MHRIPTELLQLGLVRAIGRFAGNENPDQIESFEPDLLEPILSASWYLALFEALNWTFTLDDRLRREFESADWHASSTNGGLTQRSDTPATVSTTTGHKRLNSTRMSNSSLRTWLSSDSNGATNSSAIGPTASDKPPTRNISAVGASATRCSKSQRSSKKP